MFDTPVLTQFVVGFAIGIASVVAPFLLRPFLITALTLLIVQGAILYAAGGAEAVSTGLSWLVALGHSFAGAIMGLAAGRVAAQILDTRK